MTPRQHAVDTVNKIEDILPIECHVEGHLLRDKAIQVVTDVIEDVLQLERKKGTED